ncbi:MAG: hypothetical protein A3F72_04310 [Bacteroidetes bacterium RIFCSPLOWO2_12_FULL_35_15]|nr:MAG: hypothetical protein A3F72_04310 [Bacteroidetes bacterium RIFCSPLOWO2_12_FULL_35_15]
MLKYIFKRVLIFIPTLIVITLVGFIISVNAPGNPVERMISTTESTGEIGSQTSNQKEQKKFWTEKLGLDLPIFYFSLTSFSRPDSLYKIIDRNEKEALDRLISKFGNWPQIQKYSTDLNHYYFSMIQFSVDSNAVTLYDKDDVTETLNQLKFEILSLRSSYELSAIEAKFSNINLLLSKYPFLKKFKNPFNAIESDFSEIKKKATPWKNYVPKIAFYGSENQYHHWLFGDGGKFSNGLIRGDFGTSYRRKEAISNIISEKIGWSLFFALLSVFLAYIVSIPVGIKAAANRGSGFDKSSSVILFLVYSIPSFWLATLLLMTFANTDVLHWFPESGVKPAIGYPDGAGFFEKIKISLPYIILPAICYTYSSFAFLSRTMRVSMIEIVNQDYIRTARAKGLSEKQVIWKHALRNSLLPVITVFATVFPAAIGGSVILETIFTIPGMGLETVEAIQNNDYPMIIAVLTISGLLTLIGYLVSDILYAIVDPRIRYS